MRRLLAIAGQTVVSAIRFRVVVAAAVLLGIAVVSLPLLVKHNDTARMYAQVMLTYNLIVGFGLLGFMTLWLACGTLSGCFQSVNVQGPPTPLGQTTTDSRANNARANDDCIVSVVHVRGVLLAGFERCVGRSADTVVLTWSFYALMNARTTSDIQYPVSANTRDKGAAALSLPAALEFCPFGTTYRSRVMCRIGAVPLYKRGDGYEQLDQNFKRASWLGSFRRSGRIGQRIPTLAGRHNAGRRKHPCSSNRHHGRRIELPGQGRDAGRAQ